MSGVRSLVDGVIIGAFREEETALFDGHVLIRLFHTGALALGIFLVDFLLVLLEKNVGIAQEDKPQDGLPVFVRTKMGTRAQHVGGVPEVVL